jgi:malate dehydrogenase
MNKISIIGAGRVGEQTAQFVAVRNIVKEIALLDIREGPAKGAALDIQESAPLFKFDTRVYGGADHSLIAGSDLIVITAGLPRKPGMSRSDLLASNIAIVDSLLDSIQQHAPDSILLFVTNPVDVVTYHALVSTGWPRNRIFGQAGVLDSSRMAAFIAVETGQPIAAIKTLVMGGHGDTMVPMLRYSSIGGKPLSDFMDAAKIDEIVERTRNGGAEVLALREISSAYNAPAASVLEMILAILNDSKAVLPTVCMLEGEYGHSELAIGVPARLGKNGMQEIVSLDMNADETAMFDQSAALVKKDLALLQEITAG